MGQKKKRVARRWAALFGILSLLAAAVLAGGGYLFLRTNTWGLTPEAVLAQSLPQQDPSNGDHPAAYQITPGGTFDYQGTNQCGGYSTAYLLRFWGMEVTGEAVYNEMDYKLSTGYVLPEAVLAAFSAHGVEAVLYHSNLDQLKAHVANGVPVIVLIGHGGSWQHYVTVTGYDEDNLYLYDSLKPVGEHPDYNRVMPEADFLRQWNNRIPFFQRICFVTSPQETA